MRTFSTTYLLKVIALFIRYPTAALRMLKGPEAVGHKISLLRMEKYSKKPLTEKWVNGYLMYLNPKDTTVISPSIGEDGLYELEETELFKRIIKKGAIVVDVGANIGWYTLLASKITGEEGKVVAFEPAPENFSLLTKSLDKNQSTNVRAFDFCVSAMIGTTKLYLNTQNLGGHSIKSKAGEDSIEVKTIVLDKTLKELQINNIDLLKIDVEGAEPEVIEGSLEYLSDHRIKNIFLEWNRESWVNKKELLQQIIENYEIYKFVKSPFLIKRLSDDLLEIPHTNLYLHLK